MSHLDRGELDAFRAVLARRAGLRFEDDKLELLARALTSRLQQTGAGSVAGYLRRVETAPDEVSELARTLSVTESYFLRNRDQFRALDALLRERLDRPERQLRLLSAGCSSGEEPYSLAIILREMIEQLAGLTVSILAVDLNPDALEKARAGSYSAWSLRDTPDAIRRKYFHADGGRYRVCDEVRAMVRFERQNLVSPSAGFWRNEAFDIVLCRNVLMYFTAEAYREVVGNVARSLSPGGHLFVGHAENLRGVSHDFVLKHSHDTFYYQRKDVLGSQGRGAYPSLGARVAVPDDVSWYEAIARASRRIERLSQDAERKTYETPGTESHGGDGAVAQADGSRVMDLMQQERFHEALLASASSPEPHEPDALLLRAMLLVNTGALGEAEALCGDILAVDDLHAGAHYIVAICREHAGDHSGAVEHSRAAAYLDPGFAMPHLQLGRIARRGGDLALAQRELDLALGLLPREDAARILLFGGGFKREGLIELCRGELRASGGER